MTAAVIALAAAVLLLGLLVVGLLRSHADILRVLHDADLMVDPDRAATGQTSTFKAVDGVADPGGSTRSGTDIVGVTPDGESTAIGIVGVGHRTLLAFLSSGCLTCQHFWTTFADPTATALPTDIRLVIVTHGSDQESPSKVAELAPARVPIVMSSEAWDDFDAPVSPYFCLVESDGRVVGEGASADWQQVRDLMLRANADSATPPPARAGGPDADAELTRAGIGPGDARLRHDQETG